MSHLAMPKLALVGVVLLSTVLPGAAAADEKKYLVASYVTRIEVKPVGDVEGHVAGPWERRGLCVFAGGEVATYHGSGTLDGTKGHGTVKGESSCTFDDGSSTTIVWTSTFEPGPKGLSVFKNGKGEYVRGTGRFAGIQGTVTFTGKAYTPTKDETKGDVLMDAVTTYTVPARKS